MRNGRRRTTSGHFIQDFIADVDKYITPLEEAIAVAEEFVAANERAAESAKELRDALAEEATAAADASHEADSFRRALEGIDAQAAALNGQLAGLAHEMEAVGHDSTEAGLEAAEALRHADDAAKDLAEGVLAAREAVSALARGDVELGVAEAAVTKASDLLAAAQWRLRDAMESARNIGVEVAAADADLARAETDVAAAASIEASAIGDAVTKKAEEAGAAGLAADADKALAAASGIAAEAQKALAMALALSTASSVAAAGSNANAAKGLQNVGRAAGAAGRLLFLTGNQWHWLIAGSAEFLAVAVPAMIAMGAAALDAAQGAQMVQEHMVALWTAAEATGNMFHETAGQALGFKDSLQAAQNAANGQVYEALGGALEAVGGKMTAFQAGSTKALSNIGTGFRGLAGAGNQLLGVFDAFVAKVQIDLVSGAGSEIHGILSHMVTDATQLGQVFGNLGHIVLTLASDMPGLAEKLLAVAAGLTHVVNWAVNLGAASHYVILMAMAIEEAGRWGQLLVSILGRVGLATEVFSKEEFASANFFQKIGMGVSNLAATIGGILPKIIGGITTFVGQGVSALARFIPAADGVGTAIEDMGAKITAVAADPVLMGWVGLVIASLAGLAIAFDKNRTAVQSWVDSVNQAVANQTPAQALTTLSNALAQVRVGIADNEAKLHSYSPAMQNLAQNANGVTKVLPGVSEGMDKVSIAAGKMVGHFLSGQAGFQTIGHWLTNLENARGAALALDVLTRSQQQWVAQSQNVAVRAAELAHAYGTTFTGALELAAQAGVKLQDNLTKTGQLTFQQRVQIGDYTQGLLDMGQATGEVGADMTALAIQSGLQASKVGQLNQAWDQFMQNLTGGTAGLAGFENSISNMGHVAARAGQNLATYAGQVNSSVSQFANSLKSYSGKGAASWQQFDQVVGQTAPQMIDWFRTAGAEGALSSRQFSSAVQGMVAQLYGFASKAPAARATLVGLAQEANSSVTSWKALTDWVKNDHQTMAQWQDGVTKATEKMAQMGQVAQNLGNVMGSQLTSTLDSAKVSASGLTTEAQSLTQGLQNTSTPASVLIQRADKMRTTLTELAGTRSAADEYLHAWLNSFGGVGRALWNLLQSTQRDAPKIPQSLSDAINKGVPGAQAAASHIAHGVQAGVTDQNLPGKLGKAGSDSSSQFLHGLNSKTQQITQWAKQVNTSVKGELNHLPPAATAAGKAAGAGLVAGMRSEQGAVAAEAAAMANAASAAIKHALQSHSPSLVTMQIGEDAAQGFAIGLSNGTPALITAADRLALELTRALGGYGPLNRMERIGKETAAQLIRGLTGSVAQVKKAADDLMNTLHAAIAQGMAKGDLSGLQRQHDLRLATVFAQDNKQLQSLASEREKILAQIKKAEQYASSTASSLIGATGLAGVQQPTDPKTGKTLPWTVQSIQSQMGTQLDQLKAFDHNIDVLKKMGLNKTLLNQIIQAGYQQGGALAQALAHGSEAQIKSLNSTEEAIIKASKKIGKDAADAMYDTGKNAGKGFLSGLKSQEKEIEKEMEKIAKAMIKAIEKALKIKSPSQEMYARGMWAAQGLAKGLLDGEPIVLAAAKKLATAITDVKVNPPKTHLGVQPGGQVIQIAPAPPLGIAQPMVVVHQHIAGSVLSEQQLQQYVQSATLKYTHRNQGNGLFLPGRGFGTPISR